MAWSSGISRRLASVKRLALGCNGGVRELLQFCFLLQQDSTCAEGFTEIGADVLQGIVGKENSSNMKLFERRERPRFVCQ